VGCAVKVALSKLFPVNGISLHNKLSMKDEFSSWQFCSCSRPPFQFGNFPLEFDLKHLQKMSRCSGPAKSEKSGGVLRNVGDQVVRVQPLGGGWSTPRKRVVMRLCTIPGNRGELDQLAGKWTVCYMWPVVLGPITGRRANGACQCRGLLHLPYRGPAL
jgi:hypothetical protein